MSDIHEQAGRFTTNDTARNRQQVYNANTRSKEEKDEVVEVMDVFQREKGTEAKYIREVSLAP